MGGRDAAVQVGTMLVASAATMLTTTAMPAPRSSPPTATPVGTKPVAPSTHGDDGGQRRPDDGAEHGGDDGLDEQRGHHRGARHAVGAEHAEFPGAVGDRSGGGDGHLDDADQQHGHRDQHDGAADLVGVAERRRLGPDAVGHAEHEDHQEGTVAVVTTGSTISPIRRRAASQP